MIIPLLVRHDLPYYSCRRGPHSYPPSREALDAVYKEVQDRIRREQVFDRLVIMCAKLKEGDYDLVWDPTS